MEWFSVRKKGQIAYAEADVVDVLMATADTEPSRRGAEISTPALRCRFRDGRIGGPPAIWLGRC